MGRIKKEETINKTVIRYSRKHKLLGLKAAKEVKRVLPVFERENPKDKRPREAIEALMAWAQGKRELGMIEVRKLSLGSHAAARKAKTDAARFVARAAGQAVAMWHVPNHAAAVPVYILKAVVSGKNKPSKK